MNLLKISLATQIRQGRETLEVSLGRSEKSGYFPNIFVGGKSVYGAAVPYPERRIALEWIVERLSEAVKGGSSREGELTHDDVRGIQLALATRDATSLQTLAEAA
jgi:hypothetical protein